MNGYKSDCFDCTVCLVLDLWHTYYCDAIIRARMALIW
jgi:hypothetical protein